MAETLNIYKSLDGWTAVIITDEHGLVIDCQITFKTTRTRRKQYKQKMRVELPEDRHNQTPEVGAWQ